MQKPLFFYTHCRRFLAHRSQYNIHLSKPRSRHNSLLALAQIVRQALLH